MRSFKDPFLIGSVESSHCTFTYYMKKQGKSWTGLIEVRVNGKLQAVLETTLGQLIVFPAVTKASLLQGMHT